MQAKQLLATMSNELGSALSGVVTMAEVLATTDLHAEQRQLMDVMVTSGDLIFQLINILDLSKIKSGEEDEMSFFPIQHFYSIFHKLVRFELKDPDLVSMGYL
jgi:signal transduction histidine kinase